MVKELFYLARLLFKSNPRKKNEVTLIGLTHFPFKGYKYLMWCGYMIYRKENEHKIAKEMLTKQFDISKNHETIHLMQAKACGSWARYYWKYFIEWVKGGIIMAPVSSAYYTNPFEMEAYANEDNFEYPEGMIIYEDNYSSGSFGKYIIKNGRKELYKEIGKENWKEYIKTL